MMTQTTNKQTVKAYRHKRMPDGRWCVYDVELLRVHQYRDSEYDWERVQEILTNTLRHKPVGRLKLGHRSPFGGGEGYQYGDVTNYRMAGTIVVADFVHMEPNMFAKVARGMIRQRSIELEIPTLDRLEGVALLGDDEQFFDDFPDLRVDLSPHEWTQLRKDCESTAAFARSKARSKCASALADAIRKKYAIASKRGRGGAFRTTSEPKGGQFAEGGGRVPGKGGEPGKGEDKMGEDEKKPFDAGEWEGWKEDWGEDWEAQSQGWHGAGLSPEEVDDWVNEGFDDPDVVAEWLELDWIGSEDHETAAEWADAGFDPGEVAAWADIFENAEDATLWKSEDFTPAQANALSPVLKNVDNAVILRDMFAATDDKDALVRAIMGAFRKKYAKAALRKKIWVKSPRVKGGGYWQERKEGAKKEAPGTSKKSAKGGAKETSTKAQKPKDERIKGREQVAQALGARIVKPEAKKKKSKPRDKQPAIISPRTELAKDPAINEAAHVVANNLPREGLSPEAELHVLRFDKVWKDNAENRWLPTGKGKPNLPKTDEGIWLATSETATIGPSDGGVNVEMHMFHTLDEIENVVDPEELASLADYSGQNAELERLQGLIEEKKPKKKGFKRLLGRSRGREDTPGDSSLRHAWRAEAKPLGITYDNYLKALRIQPGLHSMGQGRAKAPLGERFANLTSKLEKKGARDPKAACRVDRAQEIRQEKNG